jgi:hypothetical protein
MASLLRLIDDPQIERAADRRRLVPSAEDARKSGGSDACPRRHLLRRGPDLLAGLSPPAQTRPQLGRALTMVGALLIVCGLLIAIL